MSKISETNPFRADCVCDFKIANNTQYVTDLEIHIRDLEVALSLEGLFANLAQATAMLYRAAHTHLRNNREITQVDLEKTSDTTNEWTFDSEVETELPTWAIIIQKGADSYVN